VFRLEVVRPTENSEPRTERMTMAKHDITVLGLLAWIRWGWCGTDQLQALKADTMGFIVGVRVVGKLGRSRMREDLPQRCLMLATRWLER
jgi:hypothetical protein